MYGSMAVAVLAYCKFTCVPLVSEIFSHTSGGGGGGSLLIHIKWPHKSRPLIYSYNTQAVFKRFIYVRTSSLRELRCFYTCFMNAFAWSSPSHLRVSPPAPPPRWPSGLGVRLGSGRSGLRIPLVTGFFRVESYQWLKNWHSSGYPARRLAL